MDTISVILVIISAIIGIIIGFLSGKKIGKLTSDKECSATQTKLDIIEKELSSLKNDYTLLQEKNNVLTSEKNDILRNSEVLQKEIILLKEQNTQALNSQKQHYEGAITEMQKRFDETIEKVTSQVKEATNDMLKERQKEFAESSNQNLGLILNPLKDSINEMKVAMDASKTAQTQISSEMKAHMEHMLKQSLETQKSAEELTKVFKHGTKIQGDWGETVLDELLQSQGLTKGIHYDVQAVINSANMRPDIILHLDTKRELIIDSKVSMTAYIDYVNAENEDDRQKFLKAHIESIQRHVKELAAKNYANYIKPPKVKIDYVIMFVPHSSALWTALNAQPDLWRKSMEQNVYIADEQTLYAALRIVNITWSQIQQAQNHEKVFDLANEMLNRLGQFYKEYQEIGKALENAKAAYDQGEKKITTGRQSITKTAQKLISLGAKQSNKNPLPYISNNEDINDLITT